MFTCTHNTSLNPYSKCVYKCGDGRVVSSYNETCDDGNSTDGIGCSSTCNGTVPGYICTGGDLT